MKKYRGVKVQLRHSLPRYWMEVNIQLHAPATLLKITLKWIYRKQEIMVWTTFIWHTGHWPNLVITKMDVTLHVTL
jgi:hypothetical protein